MDAVVVVLVMRDGVVVVVMSVGDGVDVVVVTVVAGDGCRGCCRDGRRRSCHCHHCFSFFLSRILPSSTPPCLPCSRSILSCGAAAGSWCPRHFCK